MLIENWETGEVRDGDLYTIKELLLMRGFVSAEELSGYSATTLLQRGTMLNLIPLRKHQLRILHAALVDLGLRGLTEMPST